MAALTSCEHGLQGPDFLPVLHACQELIDPAKPEVDNSMLNLPPPQISDGGFSVNLSPQTLGSYE